MGTRMEEEGEEEEEEEDHAALASFYGASASMGASLSPSLTLNRV
jgi:hypothetical protein